ncbi:response regulator transcription factor [Chitinophaga niabensis]|nr:response regulator transcription factor [Chitinophaga niabensis]
MAIKVLVAENDELLTLVLKNYLSGHGYEVYIAYNGEAAWKLFNKIKFDICLLDIMMPILDGYALATKIRAINKQLPIIYLSGMIATDDIIKGLETGADDYMTKPYNYAELVLRMEVFLKRAARTSGKIYTFGKYVLDTEKYLLTTGDLRVGLPMKEVKILSVLAKNIRTTVSRENIIQEVWNKSEGKIERPLHIFIHRIRKHLRADPRVEIETIRNVGYRLQVFDGIN